MVDSAKRPTGLSDRSTGRLTVPTITEGKTMKIIAAQREFWRSLAWYEKAMVLTTLVPGIKMFKCYLNALLIVVRALS